MNWIEVRGQAATLCQKCLTDELTSKLFFPLIIGAEKLLTQPTFQNLNRSFCVFRIPSWLRTFQHSFVNPINQIIAISQKKVKLTLLSFIGISYSTCNFISKQIDIYLVHHNCHKTSDNSSGLYQTSCIQNLHTCIWTFSTQLAR